MLTATAQKHLQQELTESLLLNNSRVIVSNLDLPNILCTNVRDCWRLREKRVLDQSFFPLHVNELKKKLKHYPRTLIYLLLKWCSYTFKMFLEEMGGKVTSLSGTGRLKIVFSLSFMRVRLNK